MSVRFREAKADDLGFVLKSWSDSYKKCNTSGLIPMDQWWVIMAPVFKGILARSGVSLTVAYNPDAPGGRYDLHGWIAVERGYLAMSEAYNERYKRWETKLRPSGDVPLVHYCYVKETYRLRGLARGLFKAAKVDPLSDFRYSCSTATVPQVSGKMPGGEWEPLICRFAKKDQP